MAFESFESGVLIEEQLGRESLQKSLSAKESLCTSLLLVDFEST